MSVMQVAWKRGGERRVCHAMIGSAVTCLVVGVAACGGSGGSGSGAHAGSGKSVTLQLEDYLPSTDALTLALDSFAKKVKQDTAGAVNIDVHPDGQLVSEDKSVQALRTGSISMGISGDDLFGELVPGVDVASAPGFLTTWDQARAIAESQKVRSVLDQQYSSQGLKFLGMFPYGFSNLITKRPVANPSDLKGMKIRVPGGAGESAVTALGGSPVTMSIGEVFEGLQVNTVDGALSTPGAFQKNHWYQVAKNVDVVNLNMSWVHLAMNKSAWDKLDSDAQQAILRDVKVAIDEQIASKQKETTDATTAMQQAGAHVVKPADMSSFERLMAGARAKFQTRSDLARQLTSLEKSMMGSGQS